MKNDAPEKRESTLGSALRQIAPYTHLGWQLITTVALFAVIGAIADRFTGFSPVLLILGCIAGITLGLYSMLKSAKKLMSGRP